MHQEIIAFLAACPAVSKLTGGVAADYAGGSTTGLALKSEPAIRAVYRYLDGTALLRRDFKVEIYCSFSGDTQETVENHSLLEAIQDYVQSAPFPFIPEGEIIRILSDTDSTSVKSAVGEGLLSFRFSVYYRARERRRDGCLV